MISYGHWRDFRCYGMEVGVAWSSFRVLSNDRHLQDNLLHKRFMDADNYESTYSLSETSRIENCNGAKPLSIKFLLTVRESACVRVRVNGVGWGRSKVDIRAGVLEWDRMEPCRLPTLLPNKRRVLILQQVD